MVRRLGIRDLRAGTAVDAGPLPGYTALAWTETPYGRRLTRFTVVYREDQAFVFAAARKDPNEHRRFRTEFLNTALSLHPLAEEEWALARERRLKVIRATAQTRYADLARGSGLGGDAEARLRLINHQFPAGEPRPGTLIKTVE